MDCPPECPPLQLGHNLSMLVLQIVLHCTWPHPLWQKRKREGIKSPWSRGRTRPGFRFTFTCPTTANLYSPISLYRLSRMPHDSAIANTRQRKELKIIVPSSSHPREDATVVTPDTSQSKASSNEPLYIPVHKRPGWKSPYPSEPPLPSRNKPFQRNSRPVNSASAEPPPPTRPLMRYSREVLMDSRFHKSSTRTSMKRGVERTCPEILKDNATGGSGNATVQPPVGVGADANQPRRDGGRPKRKGRGAANTSRGNGRSQRGGHAAKGWAAFRVPPSERVSRPAQGAV
jgi:hypothetical protein